MKTLCEYLQIKKGIFLVTIFVFLLACSNGDDPSPPVEKFCRIVSETSTSSGPFTPDITFTHNVTNTNAYDERGNNTNKGFTNTYNYSDGKTLRSSSTHNQEYDTNDFLQRTFVQNSTTYLDGQTTNSSADVRYEFADNRVSKANSISTSNGIATTSSTSYEYDSQGRLIKLTNNNNSYAQFEYIGDHGYKITRVDKNGNSSAPFIEFNAAGLIVKSIVTDIENQSTTEHRFEYNADELEIRRETYFDGKPFNAEEKEYDTKKHPYAKSFPAPKGHPAIPSTLPSPNYKHNVTKLTRFTGNVGNGQWDLKEVVTYTYEYNSQDLPVKVTAKTKDKDGVETTETTILEYQDCP